MDGLKVSVSHTTRQSIFFQHFGTYTSTLIVVCYCYIHVHNNNMKFGLGSICDLELNMGYVPVSAHFTVRVIVANNDNIVSIDEQLRRENGVWAGTCSGCKKNDMANNDNNYSSTKKKDAMSKSIDHYVRIVWREKGYIQLVII